MWIVDHQPNQLKTYTLLQWQLLPCTSIDSPFGGLVNRPPEPIEPPSRFYKPTFAHGILILGGGSPRGDEVL